MKSLKQIVKEQERKLLDWMSSIDAQRLFSRLGINPDEAGIGNSGSVQNLRVVPYRVRNLACLDVSARYNPGNGKSGESRDIYFTHVPGGLG